MKNRLIILFFLILLGISNTLFAQNDRSILRYSVINKNGDSLRLTFTIESINHGEIVLHWASSEKREGDISLPSSAWKGGIRGFYKFPPDSGYLKLGHDQTIASFSQDFFAEIKEKGEAVYDGIQYIKDQKSENFKWVIGGEKADIISLKSVEGNIEVWMLNNPDVPLVVKAINLIPDCTIELEDAGSFFFWKDVKNYKSLFIPEEYVSGKGLSYFREDNRNVGRYKNVADYLPENYVRDGTEDYTEYLQVCLNANKFVMMPDFPVLINDGGLDVRNNQNIFFQRNSKLILKPSDKQRYEMLRIKNVKNVTVLNANLIGDRDEHLATGGEWGMGISITGSQKITIKNAHITNCWGDGIYIGRLKKLARNIRIENCVIDDVRRNGLSVISAVNLKVADCVFANTNGTDPQCGIDIEPNNTRDALRRINFENNITFNNKHSGFLIYLNPSPRKDKKHKVTINISNNFDDHSLNPVRISGFFMGDMKEFKPMKGRIKIKNLGSKDNKPSIINKNILFPPIVLE